jgi:hypothetical protein
MEMLPGGLVVERDTNLADLAVLMAEMQNGEAEASEQNPQSQAYLKHAEILTKVTQLTELVEDVETEYWRWCNDADALPFDMVAKQQVQDWLSDSGEKPVALAQIWELGARRCIGPGNPMVSAERGSKEGCRRFLQYGLYKSKVRRCPACSKESKRLVALCASEAVQSSASDTAAACRSEEGRLVTLDEAPPSSIPVEARETCFALYSGCPNTYFRAFLLPSDLAVASENGTTVMVSWIDGDRRNRAVPTNEVIMMDSPKASDVKSAQAAHWDNETQRLVPRSK